MEEQLTAGLGEGEISEFVEDDEVEPGEMIGDAARPAGSRSASSWLTRSSFENRYPLSGITL
jgi:hypothetical protein